MIQVHLEMFEGPLDLLLFLIKKDDLDVYNIPISQITSEYLSYLDMMKDLNLDMAGEFLVLAANLMAIKARMLLPSQPAEGEEEGPDPRAELVARLLEYQQFKQAAKFLEVKAEEFRDIHYRGAPHFEESDKALSLSFFDLLSALKDVLDRTEDESREVLGEEFPIEEKIAKIQFLLENKPAVSWDELFADERKRRGVISCFLALLELVKLQKIFIRQDDAHPHHDFPKNGAARRSGAGRRRPGGLTMEEAELKNAVHALLFITDHPLSLARLTKLAGLRDESRIAAALAALRQDLAAQAGPIQILEVAEGYQLATKAAFAPFVRKLFAERMTMRLSTASLETLAIVAYKQPLTRAEIEQIRGVEVIAALETLLEKRLIRVVGRKETVGRPLMYGTAVDFLRHFGLRSLEDLPSLETFLASAQEPGAPAGVAGPSGPFSAGDGSPASVPDLSPEGFEAAVPDAEEIPEGAVTALPGRPPSPC